jgi:hypothetical protein
LEKQTEALKAALADRGGRSTVTSVRADIQWMNLTDDLSDVKDVADFYENFEDNCAMANDCRGIDYGAADYGAAGCGAAAAPP